MHRRGSASSLGSFKLRTGSPGANRRQQQQQQRTNLQRQAANNYQRQNAANMGAPILGASHKSASYGTCVEIGPQDNQAPTNGAADLATDSNKNTLPPDNNKQTNNNNTNNNNNDNHDDDHAFPRNPKTSIDVISNCSDKKEHRDVSVGDILGAFGWFQFLVLLFSGVREGSVGYDAVVMSIILRPEHEFFCNDGLAGPPLPVSRHLVDFNNNITEFANSNISSIAHILSEQAQCHQTDSLGRPIRDPQTGNLIRCQEWVFPKRAAPGQTEYASLVIDWELVCHRHWLRAAIESAYFFGLVTGNLVWGFYADKVGRRRAYLTSHIICLVGSCASLVAPSIELFAVTRFISAFGAIGYNIIYSIQVELIGTKYRAFSTMMNHLGWGLGVICVPVAEHLFAAHHRLIIAVAPMIAIITLPAAFWIPESCRWLMANGQYAEARSELIRAAKFNGKHITPELDKQIQRLNDQISAEFAKANDELDKGSVLDKSPYRVLFESRKLVRDTLLLAYVSFTGHMFYYVNTINFAYVKNLSSEANFIISGAGEWVSVMAGAVLLRLLTRKACMSLCLTLMALSFGVQSLIDSEMFDELDSPLVVTLNNAVGTLTSLLLVFVALIVNQEIYPTIIRQTGSSLVNTIGESGSTMAPVIIQLSRMVGEWETQIVYSVICMAGAIGIQFLTRTDDIELLDT